MAKRKTKTEKELESYLDLPMSESKVRVTTYIDGDVYRALKEQAAQHSLIRL